MTDIVIEGTQHDLPFVYGVLEYLKEQDVNINNIHVSPIFRSLANSFKLDMLNKYKPKLKKIIDTSIENEETHKDVIVYDNDDKCELKRIIGSYRILEKIDNNENVNQILYVGSSFNQREKHIEKEIFNGRKEAEMIIKFNERGTQCSWKDKWTKIDELKRNSFYIICFTFSYVYILCQRCSSIHITYIKEFYEFINKCVDNLFVIFS